MSSRIACVHCQILPFTPSASSPYFKLTSFSLQSITFDLLCFSFSSKKPFQLVFLANQKHHLPIDYKLKGHLVTKKDTYPFEKYLRFNQEMDANFILFENSIKNRDILLTKSSLAFTFEKLNHGDANFGFTLQNILYRPPQIVEIPKFQNKIYLGNLSTPNRKLINIDIFSDSQYDKHLSFYLLTNNVEKYQVLIEFQIEHKFSDFLEFELNFSVNQQTNDLILNKKYSYPASDGKMSIVFLFVDQSLINAVFDSLAEVDDQISVSSDLSDISIPMFIQPEKEHILYKKSARKADKKLQKFTCLNVDKSMGMHHKCPLRIPFTVSVGGEEIGLEIIVNNIHFRLILTPLFAIVLRCIGSVSEQLNLVFMLKVYSGHELYHAVKKSLIFANSIREHQIMNISGLRFSTPYPCEIEIEAHLENRRLSSSHSRTRPMLMKSGLRTPSSRTRQKPEKTYEKKPYARSSIDGFDGSQISKKSSLLSIPIPMGLSTHSIQARASELKYLTSHHEVDLTHMQEFIEAAVNDEDDNKE